MKKISLFIIAFFCTLLVFAQTTKKSNATVVGAIDTTASGVVISASNGEEKARVAVGTFCIDEKEVFEIFDATSMAIADATFAFADVVSTSIAVGINDNCQTFVVVGSEKNGITEKRDVSAFSAIDASSMFTITVTKGDVESLTITADEELMPYLKSEVKNGVLKLYYQENKQNRRKQYKSSPEVHITMKQLQKVDLSGSCRLTVNGVFESKKFVAGLSGASSLKLEINAPEMTIGASGASKINLQGKTTNANIDASGSSTMQLDLQATKVGVDVSGASGISLSGKADRALFDASGASKINAFDFEIKKATTNLSGSSRLQVNAADELSIDVSGMSIVYYKGNPTFKSIETSGMSKIKKVD